ncbi:GNAT family N-acetyltransferase [Terrilactibacillus sp. BCM23-1]|uniref:GNAT family N-acetyltransferase n=1 Tax=Terrilactibacillus tamarindi TaxID=2599694 RepID=A0A6N8CM10_9BACI|nr:GNAT family N-acetyltransferase [Terrilactibacillus tamarindi]
MRLAEEKDIKELQKIAERSWHDTYSGIIPEKIQDEFIKRAYSDSFLLKRLKHSFFIVAILEGKIVGFANFSFKNLHKDVELSAIYLLPEFQRKKIGTTLLREGIKQLSPIFHLYVDVEKENKKALSFYQSQGFRKIKEFDAMCFGHRLQTVKMVLDLEPLEQEDLQFLKK